MKKLKPYLIFSIFLGVTACGGGSEEASQEIPAKKSQNMAPVAIIQSKNNPLPIVVGSAIVLDGSESTDDGSHALQYKWSVKPKPENGYAYIGPTNTNTFNFIPDTIGNYEVSLVVNDGKLDIPISVVSIDVVEKQITQPPNELGKVVFRDGFWTGTILVDKANVNANDYTWSAM
ncbi:MAG: PKD domain-containing protein, partial [Acinetobacter sp.]